MGFSSEFPLPNGHNGPLSDILQENAVTVAIQPSLQMGEAERGWGPWEPPKDRIG